MYIIWGKVKKGKGRGKGLGFPTANIALHKKIPEGVYISRTKVGGVWHPSLTFIGAAKTFNETKVQAETYIVFSLTPERWKAKLVNLYAEWISIKLLLKTRGNKKFRLTAELIKQMKQDLSLAFDFFSKQND